MEQLDKSNFESYYEDEKSFQDRKKNIRKTKWDYYYNSKKKNNICTIVIKYSSKSNMSTFIHLVMFYTSTFQHPKNFFWVKSFSPKTKKMSMSLGLEHRNHQFQLIQACMHLWSFTNGLIIYIYPILSSGEVLISYSVHLVIELPKLIEWISANLTNGLWKRTIMLENLTHR